MLNNWKYKTIDIPKTELANIEFETVLTEDEQITIAEFIYVLKQLTQARLRKTFSFYIFFYITFFPAFFSQAC